MPLLSVRDLGVTFKVKRRRDVRAVDDISFDIEPGQTVGIVGESGCGKSVTSLAILGLLPPTAHVSGSVTFEGRELLGLPDERMRDVRGRRIAMIFQDPMTSLNPVLTVGRQISEVLERHFDASEDQARAEAITLLDAVGIPSARRRYDDYPHQFSGGMRQRAMIAISLACKPELLIADEPTTALDVTIQAQILQLLRDLIEERGTALILITHDLGVVAGTCETVHVMYSGRIVESGGRRELFRNPRHPYTVGLLGSVPRLDGPRGEPLHPITGSPLDTIPWTSSCAFAPRCPNRIEQCTAERPDLEGIDYDHRLRCFNPVANEEAAS